MGHSGDGTDDGVTLGIQGAGKCVGFTDIVWGEKGGQNWKERGCVLSLGCMATHCFLLSLDFRLHRRPS